MFEIYKINPSEQTWTKIEYDNPIVQTIGSRPLFRKDAANGQYNLFVFSGQVPLQRINAGVKVCPPDIHIFDSENMQWQRMRSHYTKNQAPVVGRKNFSMSMCDDLIFISGG